MITNNKDNNNYKKEMRHSVRRDKTIIWIKIKMIIDKNKTQTKKNYKYIIIIGGVFIEVR